MPTCNRRLLRFARTAPFLSAAVLMASSAVRAERYECLVRPYLEVELSSGVPGILADVLVDRGDPVKKGQVLALLDSEVEEAQIQLIKAKAELAERRLDRTAGLYLKQIISPDEKDQLETEAHLLRLEQREAEARLKRRTLRSPLNGVVIGRFSDTGEFVSDEPILKLVQIDPLLVEVTLPVQALRRVRVGMTGSVEWEVPVGGPQAARVTVVDPVVDAASGTFGVRLELANPKNRLPAGTKCSVTFQ